MREQLKKDCIQFQVYKMSEVLYFMEHVRINLKNLKSLKIAQNYST